MAPRTATPRSRQRARRITKAEQIWVSKLRFDPRWPERCRELVRPWQVKRDAPAGMGHELKALTQAQRRKSLALPADELKRRRAQIVAKAKAEYEARQEFALRWLRALDRLAPIARYGYDVALGVVQQAIDQDDDVEWGFDLAYEQGRLMELSNTRRDRGYNHGYDRVRPWGPGRP